MRFERGLKASRKGSRKQSQDEDLSENKGKKASHTSRKLAKKVLGGEKNRERGKRKKHRSPRICLGKGTQKIRYWEGHNSSYIDLRN